jgi:protein CWC15
VQDDDSDDDDTAELLAELQKIKKERAAEKAKMVCTRPDEKC